MATIPLGRQAYLRKFAGEPEIKLENRFFEANPTNLREQVALISRCGTTLLDTFDSGGLVNGNRATFSKTGLFNSDLFVVSGPNLYRWATDGTKTQVTGVINGAGNPTYAWMKGVGYQYLFIADGLLLQYYAGGSHATGTLTSTGSIDTSDVIQIGDTYYGWNAAVDTGSPDGSAAHPWLANPGSDPLTALANLINFNGIRGTDFSTALPGPSSVVQATPNGGPPATTLTITAVSEYTDGNSIATVVTSGTHTSWGAATLSGGGVHTLVDVPVPPLALSDSSGAASNVAKALASLSSYVLVSVGNTQGVYFILPGEVTIDALNFFEKESNPDNVVDITTIGDQAIITGEGSTENWYATGNFDAPFAPVEGRVYRRGVIDGTNVAVKDSLVLVGDDSVVYSIGYAFGDTAQWGVHRISTNAIEERIRTQLAREQGLT